MAGIETVISQDYRLQRLKFNISAVSARNSKGISIASAAENVIFDAVSSHNLTDAKADFSRATDAAGSVNLNDLHATSSQKK